MFSFKLENYQINEFLWLYVLSREMASLLVLIRQTEVSNQRMQLVHFPNCIIKVITTIFKMSFKLHVYEDCCG